MKRFNLLLIISAAFMVILAACGGNDEQTNETEEAESTETTEVAFQPEDINPDSDVCDVCAMAVADDQHATQIVLNNERSLKFDDLGCLYGWIEENGEDEIGAKFVRDFNTEEWIQIEDATFVYDEDIKTPMAYGMISFKDSTGAEEYVEEHGIGELLSADDLVDHEWKMMKHDGEGHGDEGHGEQSHDEQDNEEQNHEEQGHEN